MKIVYKAPCGELAIVVSDGLVCRCSWLIDFADGGGETLIALSEKYEVGEKEKTNGTKGDYNSKDAIIIKEVISQLDEYFAGKRKEFDLPLQVEGTAFRKKVWQALTGIPYGEVVSYSELADRCGCHGGQRAVAQACSTNIFPILIPCHRVVKSDGSLGGYTITTSIKNKGITHQGLYIKRFLLEHESKN